MNFIDLFAGLGGFHQAMQRLGHTCVYASEKKQGLAELYEQNYGIKPNRDIQSVFPNSIPDHDILCAGFPCQPFSKAGKQEGLEDENNGSFFDKIVEILRAKKPQYFILENVRNIESHDSYKTWDYIMVRLEELGYSIDRSVLSPHLFNIPQHRERLFIVGSLSGLDHFNWPEQQKLNTSTSDYLVKNNNHRKIEEEKVYVMNLWQEFLDRLPKSEKIPGFPIWAMEFGATYPYERKATHLYNSTYLSNFKGSFGESLKGLNLKRKYEVLPSYIHHSHDGKFPHWKKRYIRENRKLYLRNKERLDPVVRKISELPVPSWQKFEWNCSDLPRNISDYIIQFRASGMRVKKTDFFPSLVTTSTQVPIIGWEQRYISVEEGQKIQSFDNIDLPKNVGAAFGALGNAVNTKLVELIAQNLIVDLNMSGSRVDSINYNQVKNSIIGGQ